MSEGLHETEIFWRDHQEWLQSNGYMLRPRYMPNWKPSWEGTDKMSTLCEDWLVPNQSEIFMDATRISDGSTVALKKVARNGSELAIAQFFSSLKLKDDPNNHCVHIHDVLSIPDDPSTSIIVMPYLVRFFTPPFETVGELVDFFQQIFEGLHFMHAQHIAHRDCCRNNFMMDPSPLFYTGFHPINPAFTKDYRSRSQTKYRTAAPVKYYLIDFGESKYYDPKINPPLDRPGRTQDRTVPEYDVPGLYNPFLTDVYLIGNMIKSHVMAAYRGLDFMTALVKDMTNRDPAKRPSMSRVLIQYANIRRTLSSSRLRSRVSGTDEEGDPLLRLSRQAGYLKRRIKYTLLFVPPMPSPVPNMLPSRAHHPTAARVLTTSGLSPSPQLRPSGKESYDKDGKKRTLVKGHPERKESLRGGREGGERVRPRHGSARRTKRVQLEAYGSGRAEDKDRMQESGSGSMEKRRRRDTRQGQQDQRGERRRDVNLNSCSGRRPA